MVATAPSLVSRRRGGQDPREDGHVSRQPKDSPAPPPPGLGPHCVGLRVVVRRLLRGERGPTGGPAFTDLLGVMEEWTDTGTTVRAADGTLTEIALADIVSGKPVPPRPSVRHRVGVEEAEQRAAATGLGWAAHDGGTDLVFLLGGVAAAARAVRRHAVRLPEGATLELTGGDAAGPAQVQVHLDGAVVARGRAALDGHAVPWAGISDLWVAPDQRRGGLALRTLEVLLGWAAERGATTVVALVPADDAAALALAERLGLTEHHRHGHPQAP